MSFTNNCQIVHGNVCKLERAIIETRRVSVYLETHCNIGSKKAFTTNVLNRWHNCLLIYWCTTCLVLHSTIP